MASIGEAMRETIVARIRKGVDVNDASARALSAKYARRKMRHGRAPIRDWTGIRTNTLLQFFRVLSANENRVVLGFENAFADRVAHLDNLSDRQFGVSPNDRKALSAIVLKTLKEHQVIQFKKAA